MIIRESCPGDLRGITGSCRSGRVLSLYNSWFANLVPSIYHANAGAVRFPAVLVRGYSDWRGSYAPISNPHCHGTRPWKRSAAVGSRNRDFNFSRQVITDKRRSSRFGRSPIASRFQEGMRWPNPPTDVLGHCGCLDSRLRLPVKGGRVVRVLFAWTIGRASRHDALLGATGSGGFDHCDVSDASRTCPGVEKWNP